MIIKCKMCGGDILFNPGDTYGKCDSCDSVCTIPKADDEQKLNRYNRANHFRRQNEFDKAIAAYERILEEDDADAEAHWGVVLSRFGIEYVEDPATKKRIPTCHRVQVASILADPDYLAAVEHAPDAESRKLYEEQAAQIAEIQKGILAISANEKPYNVFICYKESDENGQRTRDSALAQEVYYGLTEQGYKVFFSRITLEDKLGQQYEPYIFAALNSAKVMVVIGTKPEYFNAVWVKNEWSRYLALMKNDRHRLLIPCYRDMDPYDLPEELSTLQSQDMGKIGFMQDLIRGIRKVIGSEASAQPASATSTAKPTEQAAPTAQAAPLLRRAFMFLEDGDWHSANEYAEKVLDLEPENSQAYIVKLMVERRCKSESALSEGTIPLADNSNYQKALRFSSADKRKEMQDWNQTILDRIEYNRQKGVFDSAMKMLNASKSAQNCLAAKELFATIPKFDGVKEAIKACDEKVYEINDRLYQLALDYQKDENYKKAIETFESIGKHKDSEQHIMECKRLQIIQQEEKQRRLEEEQRRRDEERERQAYLEREAKAKQKKRMLILSAIAVVAVAAFFVVTKVIIPNNNYNHAVSLVAQGKYDEAITAFEELGDYRDSSAQITETKYQRAAALNNAGDYARAYALYASISGYKDVDSIIRTDENIAAAAREAKIRTYKTVGSYVTFGTYPQTSSGTDSTAIEWLVLDHDATNNRSLLISRYGLDVQPYNTSYTDVTWENCTVRTWLNDTFLNKAFTPTEQAAILTTSVDNSKNQGYSGYNTNGGNNTQDKVFLLSYAEANKYFGVQHNSVSGSGNNTKSRVTPTAYAIKQGAYTSNSNKTAEGSAAGWWWLRSPGYDQYNAANVNYDGSLYSYYVSDDYGCVRPAFWLNLNSDIF